MLQLKNYQEKSLDTLRAYFKDVVRFASQADSDPAKLAFINQTERPYRTVPQLPGIPYVCLRVPTGGGKTVMACYALAIAAREYLQSDRALCLWLVPSNAILDQTLKALGNRSHPYRQVLDEHFMGHVKAIDLQEALHITRGDLEGETVILVGTLQALRVDDTEGRKIYEQNGDMAHHFSGLDARLLAELEHYPESSEVKPSLANVLRLRRPLIIMDEAHNARTPLSFDALARFNPSGIIEFTATPQTTNAPEKGNYSSNVLHHVSAAELKAEEMIKLPVKLRTAPEWREVIAMAVEHQKALEQAAYEERTATGEYLRPLVLLQAQPRYKDKKTITTDEVKACLLDCKVPESHIAIATGETRGIEGVDLISQECPLRFIITVQALKEGWDCSFAYVLCSVAELASATAVEQILGRILRMPSAKRKKAEALNLAYVFSSSFKFNETLSHLRDCLVENGFHKLEADAFTQGPTPGSLFSDVPGTSTEKAKDLAGSVFRIPLLAIKVGEQVELFESEHFRDTEWNLASCDAHLSGDEYSSELPPAQEGQVDISDAGKLEMRQISTLHQQMRLLGFEKGWTLPMLANWLDRQFPHPDIPQAHSSLYIHRLLTALIEERGLALDQLARDKYRLLNALVGKVTQLRDSVLSNGYQELMFGSGASRITVSPQFEAFFDADSYAASWYYEGGYRFNKHYIRNYIGELKSEGEEFQCAQVIDQLDEIEYWVRNVSRGQHSFWLQTSTDKFYPDFVARLKDGRNLVVEYKRANDWSNDDNKEKRAVGELWADRAGAVFVMPLGPDWKAITQAIT